MSYEVFISSKTLDENGQRTRDNVLAEKVYLDLSRRGLKVFFSNVSLEQLGVAAYKKAIDDVLDRVKVLVAVGTSANHLNSQWVRYEWDSFFNDILSNVKPEGKVFVYTANMNTRDLPRALRQTQCIAHGAGSLDHLYNFIANALSKLETAAQTVDLVNVGDADPVTTSAGEDTAVSSGARTFRVAVLGRVQEQVPFWQGFCHRLGTRIAQRGYALYATSAASVGVASYNGAQAIVELQMKGDAVPECRVMSDLPVNARQRRLVRCAFLRGVHVGIVVGGSLGTMEEYEILREGRGFCIPVGASGGTAFKLWSRLVEEYWSDLTPEILRQFEQLGDTSRSEEALLDATMTVVNDRYTKHQGAPQW